MKRSQSRAPSPTPTAFSGISNYRTDSYRPIRDKNVPAVPQIDYRLVSKTHFEELSVYLAAYLARGTSFFFASLLFLIPTVSPNSRSTARQKLTRLTIQQFHELSTDVYDELVRRKNEKEGELFSWVTFSHSFTFFILAIPFLPVRDEFHPKRNQARQKLATLPTSRFEDLSSDVFFELSRRYPEFNENVCPLPPFSNVITHATPCSPPAGTPPDQPTMTTQLLTLDPAPLFAGMATLPGLQGAPLQTAHLTVAMVVSLAAVHQMIVAEQTTRQSTHRPADGVRREGTVMIMPPICRHRCRVGGNSLLSTRSDDLRTERGATTGGDLRTEIEVTLGGGRASGRQALVELAIAPAQPMPTKQRPAP